MITSRNALPSRGERAGKKAARLDGGHSRSLLDRAPRRPAMLIRIPRGWEIPERDATPEALVFGRRAALRAAAVLGAGGIALPAMAQDVPAATRNPRFLPGREITGEKDATTYNNYYEFGTDKGIYRPAQKLPQRPWTVKIDGLVDQPREFGIDDLLKTMPLEERVYRLRCVEAWSMVVPWTGFPISALLKAVG